MTDVFHLGDDFLSDVATLVIADSTGADFRHSRRLIDVHTVNWNAGLGAQYIPRSVIDRRRPTSRKKSKDLIGLPARNPDVVAEI